MSYFYRDTYELFCKLLDLDPEDSSSGEVIEDMLYEKYNIEYDDADALVKDLIPLCAEGESPLTGKYYVGFCDRESDEWLLKTEYTEI